MCIPQTPLYASWCPWVSSGTVVIKHAAASLRPSFVLYGCTAKSLVAKTLQVIWFM